MSKCAECEKDVISELATLQFENDRLNRYIKMLEQALDIKDELCKVLRENKDELKEKIKHLTNKNYMQ
jgi:uncharacterized membrane protein YvbJ